MKLTAALSAHTDFCELFLHCIFYYRKPMRVLKIFCESRNCSGYKSGALVYKYMLSFKKILRESEKMFLLRPL